MEPIDICPPYWPHLIWWLIHHPHGPGNPIDKQLVNTLDAHFAALSVTALSGRLSDARIGKEIGGLGSKLASDPMPGLQALAR